MPQVPQERSIDSPPGRKPRHRSRRRGAKRLAGLALGATLALSAATAPALALSPAPTHTAAITVAQTTEPDQILSTPTARADYRYDIGVTCLTNGAPECGVPEIRIPLDADLASLLAGTPEEHPRFWSTAVAGSGAFTDVSVATDDRGLVLTGTAPLLPGDSGLVTLNLGGSEARYVPGTRAWEIRPELWLQGAERETSAPVSSSYESMLPTAFEPIVRIAEGDEVSWNTSVTLQLRAPCATAEFDGEQQLVNRASAINVAFPEDLVTWVPGEPTVGTVSDRGVWTWTPSPEEHYCGDPATGKDDWITLKMRVKANIPEGTVLRFEATVDTEDWFGGAATASAAAEAKVTVGGIGDDPGEPDAGFAALATTPARAAGAADPASFSLRHAVSEAGDASLTWTPTGPAELSTAAVYTMVPAPGSYPLIGPEQSGNDEETTLTALGTVPAGMTLAVSHATVPCMPELGAQDACVDDWAAPGADLRGVTALRLLATDPVAANAAAEFEYSVEPPGPGGVLYSTVAGAATAGDRPLPPTETAVVTLFGPPPTEHPELSITYDVLESGAPATEHAADTEETAWTAAAGQESRVAVTVRNSGADPLTRISIVSDLVAGAGELSYLRCEDSDLMQPGETLACTGTVGPLAAGEQHHSLATVTAATPGGLEVSAENALWLVGAKPVDPTPPGPTQPGVPGGSLATTGAPAGPLPLIAAVLLLGAGAGAVIGARRWAARSER